MAIARFDPFRELEAHRLFDPSIGRRDDPDALVGSAAEMEETDGEYRVKADLPEVPENEVKVSVEDGVLTVEGYGRFVRRLNVPSDVAQDQIAVKFANGVLNVRLPKSAAAKPRNLEVKIA
jgi:HSP20 family protein